MSTHTLLDIVAWGLVLYLAFWKGRIDLRLPRRGDDPDSVDIAHRPDIYNRQD